MKAFGISIGVGVLLTSVGVGRAADVNTSVKITGTAVVPTIAIVGPVVAGVPFTVNIDNGPGNPTDWIGVAGGAIYQYLNGSTISPPVGVKKAALKWTIPAAGKYNMVFYCCDHGEVLALTTFTVLPGTTAPTANITVTPIAPVVQDTAAKGDTVATYTVSMSDGSPFTGSVQFVAPNFDDSGRFALSGNKVIVNPLGPGIGAASTRHVTLGTSTP